MEPRPEQVGNAPLVCGDVAPDQDPFVGLTYTWRGTEPYVGRPDSELLPGGGGVKRVSFEDVRVDRSC